MPVDLSILYRGPLSSCNYACGYCPFAKHRESAAELARDRQALNRFVAWLANRREDRFAILFTPWGEALVRRWYREAMVTLSRLPNISKVAVQTNLSCSLDWLAAAEPTKIGLWCTYHPGETAREKFLEQCARLDRLNIRYSVGCVGLKEHRDEIAALRAALPPRVYVWINAYKDVERYYEADTLELFSAIDPLFPINNERHACRGRSCRCGTSVISVDGDGAIRRCHFVSKVIGNLYEPDFATALRPSLCPNATCGCHIGYVHLEHLDLYRTFGAGVLERVPERLRF